VVHQVKGELLNDIIVELLHRYQILCLVLCVSEFGGCPQQQIAEGIWVINRPEGSFDKYIFQKHGVFLSFDESASGGVVFLQKLNEKLGELFYRFVLLWVIHQYAVFGLFL
jgi:hypothetical protein